MIKERILVVEDESIVTELLQEFLKNLGYEIAGVTGYGEDAIVLAAERSPDLILMDIKLRGDMSGVEAAKLIRDRFDIPVVYLTAYADDDTVQRAKLTAPFGYIQKPFKGGEVRSAIEIALYRSRMEKMLKERERSYRVLAENLPGVVYRLNLHGDGRIQFFNNMIEHMTGYAAGDISSGEVCSLEPFILAEDRTIVSVHIREAVMADKPFEVEYRIHHRDGEVRYFLERGRPIRGESNRPAYIDGVILDISERKRAEEELKRACEKLDERRSFIESIVTSIQSGIIVIDLDLNITLTNPYVANLCKQTPEGLIGRNLREVCPEMWERLNAGVDSEELRLHFCNRELTVDYSRSDLRGTVGKVCGHIIAFKDLTEIVAIRREMRTKERLATMGEVVARVAHEMRNPLFAITAVAQILGMELDLTPQQKELMNSLLAEGRRLNHLVEELLDCSKELRLKKKAFDLVKIVNEAIRINVSHIADKEIVLRKNFQELGNLIVADPERIEQVLINLLQNAIDACSRGGAIDLILKEDNGNVSVAIVDNGPGIPEGSVEKIFEVFYTTKKHGTGLGLPISKKIIDAHGGSLDFKNNQDGGATFMVVLPYNTGDI
jgi:PAS domain S-box-containing protein